MKVYTDAQITGFWAKNPCLTIGTFDGVHKGHQKIIENLKKVAHEQNGETVIFTFWPHPRIVLHSPDYQLYLINTLEERIELLQKTGINHLIVYPFTKEFSQLSYFDFFKKILVDKLKINTLISGHNNVLGHNREGNFFKMEELAKQYNFRIHQTDALTLNDNNVSSTEIRKALEIGDIPTANLYLSYPYSLQGRVVEGHRIGRTLGFPTANVETEPHKLIPSTGVYAAKVFVNQHLYKGMLNIGVRPTFENQKPVRTIEVHLIGFEGNLYQKTIRLELVRKLRNEQKFSNIEDLKAQLQKDKYLVESMLQW